MIKDIIVMAKQRRISDDIKIVGSVLEVRVHVELVELK